jgi:UDPglucose 6-dehydrogenase
MIGVVGLSHLGVNTAAALSAKGFDVVGFDDRSGVVEGLRRSGPNFFEPGLAELLAEHAARISYSPDVQALRSCDVVIFALDVATDDAGVSDTTELQRLIAVVMERTANAKAVYVLLSQVTPGTTRTLAERYRDRAPQFFYQVETLVFGNAVERALRPERFIVGCGDPRRPLPEAYHEVLAAFDCPVLPMRYESAELAKISINLFLTSSVTTANVLAEVCETIGADWGEIVPALRLDRRIGPHAYLSAGLGIAGGNLERDWATVARLAAQHGAEASLVEAWRRNSAHRRDWALQVLHRELLCHHADAAIAVWGLAYKPDTTSTKNSPSLRFLSALPPNVAVAAYDPQAKIEPSAAVEQVESALAACEQADALVVMTPWKEFRDIDPTAVAKVMRGRLLVDPYGVLDAERCAAGGFHYLRLGRGPERADA